MIIIRLIEMIFTTLFRDVETIGAAVIHFATVYPLALLALVGAPAVFALFVLDSARRGK